MDPDRLQKIDDVFQAAVNMPPGSRSAFLAEACGADPQLRREVESLLLAHDSAGEFMEGSAADVAADWLAGPRPGPGRRVGRYQVLSRLGAGGMSEIYLAEDVQLGRRVALKFLPASSDPSDDSVRRFRREAEAASALNHPNILTVYEVGRWHDRGFIATEYVEGVTLRAGMRGRGLSVPGAIDITLQIASALVAAHGAGIVHRDIKPENVMVRPDGLVKVLDFGIAKYVRPGRDESRNDTKTGTGIVVGTIAYMSPEQARGLQVDLRTDIWSLGVVLFEMIAGRLPFQGGTPSDRVAAILQRNPEPLGRGGHDLERIVGRALAKSRDDRYASVADMSEDLRTLRATLDDETPFRFALPGITRALHFPRERSRMAVATLLLVILSVVGARFSYLRSHASARTIESLAILPLANVGGSADTEYLADGITESLINNLSTLPDLRVMSRNSVFRYKGREVDAMTAGSALRVQALLTGRIMQHGDDVSIGVELVDVRDGSRLWGEQYSRTLASLPALQNEVTQDVSRKLRSRISGADERRLAKSSVVNPEAYRRYLRGRYYVLKATRREIDVGVSYLRQAIDIDPTYALAYVGLADAYRVLALAGESPATEELPKAKDAAMKALQIDGELADAHAILGSVVFWYDWKWKDAENHLKRALELDPNGAETHEAYANVLSYTGKHPEALAEIRRAAELDPLNLRIGALEGAFLVNARRPDEALTGLSKTLELDQNYWFARQYVASALIDKGMLVAAIVEARKAKELSGVSTRPTAFLAYALAQSGNVAKARSELQQLLKLSNERYISPYNIAMIYHGLGQRNEALAWLERGYREREPRMVFLASEPKWDALRDDPRFKGLLRRLDLPH